MSSPRLPKKQSTIREGIASTVKLLCLRSDNYEYGELSKKRVRGVVASSAFPYFIHLWDAVVADVVGPIIEVGAVCVACQVFGDDDARLLRQNTSGRKNS